MVCMGDVVHKSLRWPLDVLSGRPKEKRPRSEGGSPLLYDGVRRQGLGPFQRRDAHAVLR